MSTEKAQADFEAWWSRQPFRDRFEDVKDQMRNVWVASRRELVIELPAPKGLLIDASYWRGINDARHVIEAVGVTVRG